MSDVLSREDWKAAQVKIQELLEGPFRINATLEALNDALVLSERARDLGCDCRAIGNEADGLYEARDVADAALIPLRERGWGTEEAKEVP